MDMGFIRPLKVGHEAMNSAEKVNWKQFSKSPRILAIFGGNECEGY